MPALLPTFVTVSCPPCNGGVKTLFSGKKERFQEFGAGPVCGKKTRVGRRRLGSVAWLGMILAGCCLAAIVFAAWPEQTTYLTRQPRGESRPKTPTVAAERKAPVQRVIASATVDVVAPPQREVEADPAPRRELAGPPPVSSELESDDSYRPETAEELGAKPLPGMDPDAVIAPATP
jgi:hypothetical protein